MLRNGYSDRRRQGNQAKGKGMLASWARSVVRWAAGVAAALLLWMPGTASAETITLAPSLSCTIESYGGGACGGNPTVYEWEDRDSGRTQSARALVRFDVASSLPP